MRSPVISGWNALKMTSLPLHLTISSEVELDGAMNLEQRNIHMTIKSTVYKERRTQFQHIT